MAQNGSTADEIVQYLENAVNKVESSFVLDTLLYLQKGGRCSSIAALGANLLKLKPCIEVIDGKMQVGKKYRGNLEKSLEMYIADRLTNRDDIDYRRIFITSTAIGSDAIVKVAEEAVKKYNVGDKINVYVVDVKPGRQQIKLSIKEFKKKMQREEISQYMSNNDDTGDSAYTLGSVINKNA